MKATLCAALLCGVMAASAMGQNVAGNSQSHHSDRAAPGKEERSQTDSGDAQQLRADIQRLKVLLNQMRTNLAFVQSSQTPLKHQFELETDAWQVVIEQMDGRLRRMEDRDTPAEPQR